MQVEKFHIEYRIHGEGIDPKVRIANFESTSKARVMAGVRGLYGTPRRRKMDGISIEFIEVVNHKDIN